LKNDGVRLAQMMYSSSLVAVVGTGELAISSPRKMQLFNVQNHKVIAELNFASSVLDIQMNRSRMIVLVEGSLHIFHINTVKLLTSLDAPIKVAGAVSLSSHRDNSYLVYAASEETGDLLVYDAENLQPLSVIHAHVHPVRWAKIHPGGKMVATASESGTVIRVFSLPEGKKLHTFRRGTMPASISSMAFCEDAPLLAVSSDSSTVHIFNLEPPKPDAASVLATTTATLTSYLPAMLNDVVNPARSYAYLTLKDTNLDTSVGFHGKDTVLVVTGSARLFRYRLPDSPQGGECKLEAEYSLLHRPSEAVAVTFHGTTSKAASAAAAPQSDVQSDISGQ
jgi:autophagy-related protein 18